MSRTIAVHVRWTLCTFRCRSLPNNVKWPSFAYFGEPRPRRQIFWISLWNWSLALHKSFSRFLHRFAHWTGLVTYEIRVKFKSIFCLASTLPSLSSIGNLRWLPTVLTISTPKGTKSELFVSTLGLSSCYSQWRLATHRGFVFHSYEYIADCCHGNRQSWRRPFFCYFPPICFLFQS